MVKMPNNETVHYTLCHKNVDTIGAPLVCSYCMLPTGHPRDCNDDPTTAEVIIALYDIEDLYKNKERRNAR